MAPLAPGAAAVAHAKQRVLNVGDGGPGNWGGSPGAVLRSAASIVDSSVALAGVAGADVPCVLAKSSLYMSDTYTLQRMSLFILQFIR